MSIHPMLAMAVLSACVCPPVAVHIAHKRAAVARHHPRPRPVVAQHHTAKAPETRIVYVTAPCLPAPEAAPMVAPEALTKIGSMNTPVEAPPVLVPIEPPPRVPAGPPLLPAVVPEPATWGMFILGFGVIGAALRRNKREAVA